MNDDLRDTVKVMREGAQGAYREGVEALISEVRRYAVAAENAIGEISLDEAFQGVRGIVVDRIAQLTGEPRVPVFTADEDYATSEAMLRMGGSFVQALGEAARRADLVNLAKLKATFPEYFTKYAELAKLHKTTGGPTT